MDGTSQVPEIKQEEERKPSEEKVSAQAQQVLIPDFHAFYINLDGSIERKDNTERELQNIGLRVGLDYTRFPGILRQPGYLGCHESHQKVQEVAIKAAHQWTMFCEDDIQFLDPPNTLSRIKQAMQAVPDAKVFILGTNAGNYTPVEPHIPGLYSVTQSQTMSGYLVRRDYLPTLLANMKEGLELLKVSRNTNAHMCDMYWKRLQGEGWYTFLEPRIAVQRPGWSDIEQRFVNYGC
jgi:hypothetical protein